jgi:protease I
MKTIGILCEDLYNEHEVIYPYYRVLEAGYHALVIGTHTGEAHSKAGLPFPLDRSAVDVSVNELAGLVIPGGYAPDRLRRDPAILSLVKMLDGQKKPIACICHGGWVLISAGVAKGRKLTGVGAIRDDLVNAGADYQDEMVVIDGNLVTSRQPGDLPAFMKAFLALLEA